VSTPDNPGIAHERVMLALTEINDQMRQESCDSSGCQR